MRSYPIFFRVLAAMAVCASLLTSVEAQQATVATPFNAVGDSFFENIGTSWGFNYRGIHAQFGGGPNQAAPAFGGFDPSAGLSGGVGVAGRNFNGSLNFNASQGSRQSLVSQTPSVTLSNGQPGFVSDTSQSPFVIGHMPVVGGYPTQFGYGYPLMAGPQYVARQLNMAMPMNTTASPRLQAYRQQMAQRQPTMAAAGQPVAPAAQQAIAPNNVPGEMGDDDLDFGGSAAEASPSTSSGQLAIAQRSSAGRAVPSVAEARQMYQREQAADDGEALALFERAQTAEETGKTGVAKIYYRMVLGRADGPLREQARARLKALQRD